MVPPGLTSAIDTLDLEGIVESIRPLLREMIHCST